MSKVIWSSVSTKNHQEWFHGNWALNQTWKDVQEFREREREIPGAEMKIQKQNWYGTVKRGGNMLGEFLLLNKQTPIDFFSPFLNFLSFLSQGWQFGHICSCLPTVPIADLTNYHHTFFGEFRHGLKILYNETSQVMKHLIYQVVRVVIQCKIRQLFVFWVQSAW